MACNAVVRGKVKAVLLVAVGVVRYRAVAVDVQAEVERYKAALEKDWYTLDEWKSLSEDDQNNSFIKSR